MNIHEYQAKFILRQYGIPVSDFFVISSEEQLLQLLNETFIEQAVLKIQVHAGGRGKAGGVKIARSRQEILEFSKQLIGMKIVNRQTGSHGVIANQLLIAPLVEIQREFYLATVIDRQRALPLLIVSSRGGMDIEEVAASSPHQILAVPITDKGTIREYNLLRIVKLMRWTKQQAEEGKKICKALAKAFVETDASLIEINPLAETIEEDLIALDAKISIDDNALFRQPLIAEFYDPTQLPPEEVEAKHYDLSYIALNGKIGCMVNGAGLAMATMDIIHLYGGEPANFLDVGGGASQDKVEAGFRIILSDPKVKAILVNIFGGIMDCKTLASGIIAAASKSHLKDPLVCRMEGTNVEEGRRLLMESGLQVIVAETLADAAQKVVNAAQMQR